MNIKYTKEEKEQIKRTFNIVLDDINSLWSLANTKEIIINVAGKGIHQIYKNYPDLDWYILLNDNGIFYYNSHYRDYPRKVVLEKIGPFNKKTRTKNIDLMIIFLKEYKTLREKIKSEVEMYKSLKTINLNLFEELERQYTKEATIEVEMPETINKSCIEISREEGKNIGKVNIGPVSLKILTSENVLLTERQDNIKIKKKFK